MERWIMHVDMDAFFASVEQLKHPEYRGRPVIVGGSSPRGVVSTASYEARAFGVHSAMPLFEAHRLCPQGIFVPGHMALYTEFSDEIMKIFKETSPLVEQLSIDEAFLDLTGMEALGGAEKIAHGVQERIAADLDLTASVGLAPNKFLAKLASDLRKPHGFVVIKKEEAAAMLAPMSVRKIFGIGRKGAEHLARYGITTIGQLAKAPLSVLEKVFGINAQAVQYLALGIDNRPVVNEYEEKSLGKETTFEEDYRDYETLKAIMLDLVGQVGWRLRHQKLTGTTVTLKIKYADFKTITRSISATAPIRWDEEIAVLATKLLQKIDLRKPVRLLGVSLSNLEALDTRPTLGFAEDEKMGKRNLAIDALKDKFGEQIIQRGLTQDNTKNVPEGQKK
jgi:DNA polymerase-4